MVEEFKNSTEWSFEERISPLALLKIRVEELENKVASLEKIIKEKLEW